MSRRTLPGRRQRISFDADPKVDRQYSIGDLSAEFGITTRAIRFYESRGLISPERRGANRIYSRRDRARLILILRGKNLGFTLEDVADYLALYDSDPGQLAQTKLLLDKVSRSIDDLNRKRADLDRTLKDLKEIKVRCIEHLHANEKLPEG
jgi:DNA-binding transcriptional MerR regulator